jgi:hypothetical protein
MACDETNGSAASFVGVQPEGLFSAWTRRRSDPQHPIDPSTSVTPNRVSRRLRRSLVLGIVLPIISGCFLGRYTTAGRVARDREKVAARWGRVSVDSIESERSQFVAATAVTRRDLRDRLAVAEMQRQDSLASGLLFRLDSLAADVDYGEERFSADADLARYARERRREPVVQALQVHDNRLTSAREKYDRRVAAARGNWHTRDGEARAHNQALRIAEVQHLGELRDQAEAIVKEAFQLPVDFYREEKHEIGMTTWVIVETRTCALAAQGCRGHNESGPAGVPVDTVFGAIMRAKQKVLQLLGGTRASAMSAEIAGSQTPVIVAPPTPRPPRRGVWTTPEAARQTVELFLSSVHNALEPRDDRLVDLRVRSSPDSAHFELRTSSGFARDETTEMQVTNLWRGAYTLVVAFQGYEPARYAINLANDPRRTVECSLRRPGASGPPSFCRLVPAVLPPPKGLVTP